MKKDGRMGGCSATMADLDTVTAQRKEMHRGSCRPTVHDHMLALDDLKDIKEASWELRNMRADPKGSMIDCESSKR